MRLKRIAAELIGLIAPIVWTGLGWLVPVIWIVALVLTQSSIDAVYGEGFYTANAWPKQAALLVAAVPICILGIYLNHVKRQALIDEETGKVLDRAPAHTLFFIPIEYWAAIVVTMLFWTMP